MKQLNENLFLSTDMIEAKLRDEFWRYISSLIYEVDPWQEKGQEGLIGSGLSRPFGAMTVGITKFNDQKVRRTRQIVTRSALEMCVVQLVLAGQAQGDFGGIDADIGLGDILIHDLTQVMSGQITAGSRLCIVVPRADLQRLVPRNNLHGIVLRAKNPRTRLLSEYLIGLDKVLADLPQDAIPAAQEALLILLASAINGRDGNSAEDTPLNLPMRQRVIDYIDRNLSNHGLSPQSIMTYFRVSRSHLYRSFEEDGGIAKIIRDRRLDFAYRTLLRRDAKPPSMKEVAHRSGLSDGVHFAKIFKDRFGILPIEVRAGEGLPPETWNRLSSLHDYFCEQASEFDFPGKATTKP